MHKAGLSISVKKKAEVMGYTNWTKKRGQLGVIPPQEILENIITLRIHLDDTNKDKGALKVVPKSHKKGIVIKENTNLYGETFCNVERGGIMAMKPLILHASGRSKGVCSRRVIHLEFSNRELSYPLKWLEKEIIF